MDDIRNGGVTDMAPIIDAYTRKDGQGRPAGVTNADFDFVANQFNKMNTPDGQRPDQSLKELLASVKPAIDKPNPLMKQPPAVAQRGMGARGA